MLKDGDTRKDWFTAVKGFKEWSQAQQRALEVKYPGEHVTFLTKKPHRNVSVFSEPMFIALRNAYNAMRAGGYSISSKVPPLSARLKQALKARDAQDDEEFDEMALGDALSSPQARAKRGRPSSGKRVSLSSLDALVSEEDEPPRHSPPAKRPIRSSSPSAPKATPPNNRPPTSRSSTIARTPETPSALKKVRTLADERDSLEENSYLVSSEISTRLQQVIDSEFTRLEEAFAHQLESSKRMIYRLCGLHEH